MVEKVTHQLKTLKLVLTNTATDYCVTENHCFNEWLYFSKNETEHSKFLIRHIFFLSVSLLVSWSNCWRANLLIEMRWKCCDFLYCLEMMLLGQSSNTRREWVGVLLSKHSKLPLWNCIQKKKKNGKWDFSWLLPDSQNNCLIADYYPFCSGQSLFILFAVMFYKYQRGCRGSISERSSMLPGCRKPASPR